VHAYLYVAASRETLETILEGLHLRALSVGSFEKWHSLQPKSSWLYPDANIKHAVQGPSSSASASELMDDLKERNVALELQIKCAKDEIALRDSKIQALDRRTRRLEERIEQVEVDTRCSDELVDELQDSKNLLADELKQVKIDLKCRASKLEKLEEQLEASKQLEINNDKPNNEHLIELENCKAELIAKLQEAELQNSD